VTTPKAPYSPIVVSGDLVLTARQVAFDTEGNIVSDEIEAQARQVFDNLRRCLEAAGSTVGEVVKVNAFLTDFDDFETYNDVYRRYFSALYPARTNRPGRPCACPQDRSRGDGPEAVVKCSSRPAPKTSGLKLGGQRGTKPRKPTRSGAAEPACWGETLTVPMSALSLPVRRLTPKARLVVLLSA
jgi:2-iminobutanoate/2-iminopropanoate deaminase